MINCLRNGNEKILNVCRHGGICMQDVVAQTEETSNPNVQAIDLRNHSSSAESRQNTYVVYKSFKPNFDHILYCWFGV